MTEQSKLLDEMRTSVKAYNEPLNEAVKYMSFYQLLANCHPRDRDNYVRQYNLIHTTPNPRR